VDLDGPQIVPPAGGIPPPLVGLRPGPIGPGPKCHGLLRRCITPLPPVRDCDWYCIPVGPRPYWQHQERENRRWEYPQPHPLPVPQIAPVKLPQAAAHDPAPPGKPSKLARTKGFGLPSLGDIPKPPPAQATAPAPAPQRAQQQAQPATGRVIDVFA